MLRRRSKAALRSKERVKEVIKNFSVRNKLKVEKERPVVKQKPVLPPTKKPPTNPCLSILIPTLNRWRNLEKCLASITVQQWPLGDLESTIEIIVLDGGSSDQTADLMAKHNTMVFVVEPNIKKDGSRKEGWPVFMNKMVRLCKAPWFLWLNDDCQLHRGALVQIAGAISANKEEIGGYALKMDINGVGPHNPTRYGVVKHYGMASMNFGLVKKDIFLEIGGFDEQYDFYHADGDFSLMVWEMGYKIKPLNAYVHHTYEHDESRKESTKSYKGDLAKFKKKWKWKWPTSTSLNE
jgi:glycosyltransferase involved in cell wall biosynthesis